MNKFKKIFVLILLVTIVAAIFIVPCSALGTGFVGSAYDNTESTVFGFVDIYRDLGYSISLNNIFSTDSVDFAVGSLTVSTESSPTTDGLSQFVTLRDSTSSSSHVYMCRTNNVFVQYHSYWDQPDFAFTNITGQIDEAFVRLHNVSITYSDGTVNHLGNNIYGPEAFFQPGGYEVYFNDVFSYLVDAYGLSDGDFVSCYVEMVVSTSSNSQEYVGIISSDGDYQPMLSSEVIVVQETVDVLSWLPSTIDSFLSVELLPGINFGTLLLMVIAIPALFAVLKMLGGGG